VLVGEATANERGVISMQVVIPEGTPVGGATVQVNGTTGSLQRLTLNIGIEVDAPVAPQSEADGQLPTVPAGDAVALDANGQPVPNAQVRVAGGVARLQVGATVATIRAIDAPTSRAVRSSRGLTAVGDGYVRVTGRGFAGESPVSVWGFSSPVLLGIVYTNADGTYDATLPLPATLGVGEHTLQSVGTSSSGERVSVSTGLRIQAPSAATKVPVKKASTRIGFARLSSSVTDADEAELRVLVRRIGVRNIVATSVTGYVQRSDDRSNDIALSRARAQHTAAVLRELGVTGKITIKGKGVLNAPSSKARSAVVTFTYRR